MTRKDYTHETTGSRVICDEYRGISYMIASRAPYSGIGWRILWENSRPQESSGAFYDGCDDHPEGAYMWAESCVKRKIDQIHATVAEFDAALAAKLAARSGQQK